MNFSRKRSRKGRGIGLELDLNGEDSVTLDDAPAPVPVPPWHDAFHETLSSDEEDAILHSPSLSFDHEEVRTSTQWRFSFPISLLIHQPHKKSQSKNSFDHDERVALLEEQEQAAMVARRSALSPTRCLMLWFAICVVCTLVPLPTLHGRLMPLPSPPPLAETNMPQLRRFPAQFPVHNNSTTVVLSQQHQLYHARGVVGGGGSMKDNNVSFRRRQVQQSLRLLGPFYQQSPLQTLRVEESFWWYLNVIVLVLICTFWLVKHEYHRAWQHHQPRGIVLVRRTM